MKILHTSDWHLGLEFFGVDPTADQQHMIGEIVRIAREQQVGAVIVAGDIFDRAVVAPDAIALYNDAMRALCLELGLPVVLIAGNHDGAARLSTLSDLLRGAGLYIAGRVTMEEMQADLGDTVIHLLPYVYTDDVRQAYPARREEIACAADAMRVVLEERRPPKDGKRHILRRTALPRADRPGRATALRRSAAHWQFLRSGFRPMIMSRWDICTGRRRWAAVSCAIPARRCVLPLQKPTCRAALRLSIPTT